MSHRYEFTAGVTDGEIAIPAEIVARLRTRGIARVRVVVTSMAEEEAWLAERGIDLEAIDRVASSQSIDRDVAIFVLGGEGMAAGSELGGRLRAFAPAPGRDTVDREAGE